MTLPPKGGDERHWVTLEGRGVAIKSPSQTKPGVAAKEIKNTEIVNSGFFRGTKVDNKHSEGILRHAEVVKPMD